MLTDTFSVLLVLFVVFSLAAFTLALVLVGVSALVDAAISLLRRCWSDMCMARNAGKRIAEIRSIGQQARREMEQLSFEFLHTVSHLKRR